LLVLTMAEISMSELMSIRMTVLANCRTICMQPGTGTFLSLLWQRLSGFHRRPVGPRGGWAVRRWEDANSGGGCARGGNWWWWWRRRLGVQEKDECVGNNWAWEWGIGSSCRWQEGSARTRGARARNCGLWCLVRLWPK
jgi:hypothetical protein